MKYIPNLLSIIRIPLSLSLFLLVYNELLFVIIYLICGLTDILDGYIARRMYLQSKSGAKLDSLADLFMFGSILGVLIIWNSSAILKFIPLLIIITLVRTVNLFLVYYKFKQLAVIHTLGNKLTGLFAFTIPLFYIYFHNINILWFILVFALLASLEESFIICRIKELDLNYKGLFF